MHRRSLWNRQNNRRPRRVARPKNADKAKAVDTAQPFSLLRRQLPLHRGAGSTTGNHQPFDKVSYVVDTMTAHPGRQWHPLHVYST